jgi:SnoaL-like domain
MSSINQPRYETDAESSVALINLERRLRVLEDREEIRELKAKYCRFNDGGWPEQGASHMGPVADLFVEDAVWDFRPYMPLAVGRDAIRQSVVGGQVVPFAMHYISNAEIFVDGDSGRGTWKLFEPLIMPDLADKLLLGIYQETYARTPEGWRFKSIRFTAVRVAQCDKGWWGGAVRQSQLARD